MTTLITSINQSTAASKVQLTVIEKRKCCSDGREGNTRTFIHPRIPSNQRFSQPHNRAKIHISSDSFPHPANFLLYFKLKMNTNLCVIQSALIRSLSRAFASPSPGNDCVGRRNSGGKDMRKALIWESKRRKVGLDT